MEVNGKRKRNQLSEDESSPRMYSLPNEAGLDYIDDSSSDDEGYIETSSNLLPSRPDSEMMLTAFDISSHVAQINGGSSGNITTSTEIMTNIMSVASNNGNNYGHSRRKWTYEMDERLREGFNIYGKQWSKVADHVGYGLHREQCRKRWSMAANIELQNRRKGEWTDEELLRLRILADSHDNRRATNNGLQRKDVVNWTLISKELNRDYKECADKYKSMMSSGMIKGPYTREEDIFIMTRVREWGNKGQGLWIALQAEMNRRSDSINKRWQRLSRSPESIVYANEPQQHQQQPPPQQQQQMQTQQQPQQPSQQQLQQNASGGDMNPMF